MAASFGHLAGYPAPAAGRSPIPYPSGGFVRAAQMSRAAFTHPPREPGLASANPREPERVPQVRPAADTKTDREREPKQEPGEHENRKRPARRGRSKFRHTPGTNARGAGAGGGSREGGRGRERAGRAATSPRHPAGNPAPAAGRARSPTPQAVSFAPPKTAERRPNKQRPGPRRETGVAVRVPSLMRARLRVLWWRRRRPAPISAFSRRRRALLPIPRRSRRRPRTAACPASLRRRGWCARWSR